MRVKQTAKQSPDRCKIEVTPHHHHHQLPEAMQGEGSGEVGGVEMETAEIREGYPPIPIVPSSGLKQLFSSNCGED